MEENINKYLNEKSVKEIIDRLLATPVEKQNGYQGSYDNLAIMICTYWDENPEKPENDPEDEERGWGEWVMKKYDETIEMLKSELLQESK